MFGGCAPPSFDNSLSALLLDVSLSAENFYASGPGTSSAMAGVQRMSMG